MRNEIQLITKGKFAKTKRFLTDAMTDDFIERMRRYGREGCRLLSEATPKRTGKTSQSWTYKIDFDANGALRLSFSNTNMIGHTPIVNLLIYGHLSKDGYWIEGEDFVSPAVKPLFKKMAQDLWKEVRRH